MTVTSKSVPVFLASSLDRNNNAEYPAASLRLQPYEVYLANLGRLKRRPSPYREPRATGRDSRPYYEPEHHAGTMEVVVPGTWQL